MTLYTIRTDSVPISQGSDNSVILLDPPTSGLPTVGHEMASYEASHLLHLIVDIALQTWVHISQDQHLRVSMPLLANTQ